MASEVSYQYEVSLRMLALSVHRNTGILTQVRMIRWNQGRWGKDGSSSSETPE